jgi:ELWxxDGT repeat protein
VLVKNHAGGMLHPTNVNGTLFFFSNIYDLWKTDGTAAGTVFVKSIERSIYAFYPENFTAAGNTLFFTSYTDTHGRELWKSDGTPEGTLMVKDIVAGQASAFGNDSQNDAFDPWLIDVNGLLYFTAGDTAGVPNPELPSNIELGGRHRGRHRHGADIYQAAPARTRRWS